MGEVNKLEGSSATPRDLCAASIGADQVSRFERVCGLHTIRSGYLVLANQHTSSEGQGSRDLRQTRVEPY